MKEYLITLLELFSYNTSRVWQEINNEQILEIDESNFMEYLKNIYKDTKKRTFFDILEIKKALDRVRLILEYCNKEDIHIITYSDSLYPKSLGKCMPLKEQPIVLYAKGNVNLLNEKAVAIIGSRNTDDVYFNKGLNLSRSVSNDFVIVSGLALGSDTAAHKGALLNNGKTIAILANGLNSIYPKENTLLAEDIIKKNGLLLSEYAPFSKTRPYYFALRDRLQAALSEAVIVIETGIKSGTMITVDYAIKYNKKIYTFNLIKNGKKYNDDGNTFLLESGKAEIFEYNDFINKSLPVSINVRKKFKFELYNAPNFKDTFIKQGNDVIKLPAKYLEISRDKKYIYCIEDNNDED